MINIFNIDKVTTRFLMEHCLDVLKKDMEGSTLTVKAAGGSIGTNEATIKFTFTLQTPEADAKREETTRQHLELLGLPADALGRTFQMRGAHHAPLTYTITGADLGKSKYNVHAKRPDGKVMRFQAHDVIRLLAMETV
jgi:hypothetical protein